jgi:ABC-2 type transport system permease protein
MSRYLEIYWLMIRNSLIREMNFKANFVLWMLVELLWFLGQIVFIEVIFQYVDQIGDWSKWEVILLIGTHQLIAQIFQAFFYVNLADLPELVRTGEARPDVGAADRSAIRHLHAPVRDGQYREGIVGIGIVIFALMKLGTVPRVDQVLLYMVAVAFGVAIHYSIMFTLSTMSFWIVRAQGLIYGYFNLFNIGRYPDVVFRGAFRVIFSYVVPVIIVANVPARILTRALESPAAGLMQVAAASVFVVVASRLFWGFALKRYSSASS